MAYNVKEIVANKPSRFTEGHRMCAGCGAPVVARHILRALKEEDHAVISTATGCMEVSTFIYPYTAWTDSFIHTAFECTSATLSGVEAHTNHLKNKENYQKMNTQNSSHLVEMVELMTLVYNHYQALWKEVMTCYMFVMTMVHT